MQTIIHDLSQDFLKEKQTKDTNVFCANVKATYCKGCFKCWLKNMAHCTYQDVLGNIGITIGNSDSIVIISRLLYGGYSSQVKRICDRGISISLPFFTYRKWEVHHRTRYHGKKKLTVIFYGDASDFEKSTAREYVNRHAINLNADVERVIFADKIEEIGGYLS